MSWDTKIKKESHLKYSFLSVSAGIQRVASYTLLYKGYVSLISFFVTFFLQCFYLFDVQYVTGYA